MHARHQLVKKFPVEIGSVPKEIKTFIKCSPEAKLDTKPKKFATALLTVKSITNYIGTCTALETFWHCLLQHIPTPLPTIQSPENLSTSFTTPGT